MSNIKPMVPLPAWMAGDDSTFMSVMLHCLDERLQSRATIEIVDNDTYESTVLPLLQNGPLKLRPNRLGYNIIASSTTPPDEVFVSGKWNLRVSCSKPLQSFNQETQSVLADFGGAYKPNFGLVVYRHVISASNNTSVSIQTHVTDESAGLKCRIYRLSDLEQAEDHGTVPPVFSLVGMRGVHIPALDVSKDQRWLIDVQIDPLTTGKVLAKQLENKRAVIAGAEDQEVEQLSYTMRVVSGVSVQVFSDKTQEEDFTQTKVAWVKSQSGRDKKSKASRQAFLDAKMSMVDYRCQPIVSEITQEEKVVTKEELYEQRRYRRLLEVKGDKHVAAMEAKRETLEQKTSASLDAREAELAKWREQISEELNNMNTERNQYREGMLADDKVLAQLKEALDTDTPMWYDNPDIMNPEVRVKVAKGGKGFHYNSLQAYIPILLSAMDGVAPIVAWKTEGLLARAEAKLSEVVAVSIKTALRIAAVVPPVVEEHTKKKSTKEEPYDPFGELIAQMHQIDEAYSLDRQAYDTTLWMDRGRKYLLESWFAMLTTFCQEPGAEGDTAVHEEKDTIEHDLTCTIQRIKELGADLSDAETNQLAAAEEFLVKLQEKKETMAAAHTKKGKGKK